MKQKTKLFTQIMAFMLVIVMTVGMIPGTAFASEADLTEPSAATETTAAATSPTESPMETQAEEDPTGTHPPVAETDPAESTLPSTEPATEAVPDETESVTEATESTSDNENVVLTEPVMLDTEVQYYEDYFALLHGNQDHLAYHILVKDAVYQNPSISAYPFHMEEGLASIGFEIHLNGVSFVDEPVVNPSAEIMVEISDIFQDSDPANIVIFDIAGDSWFPLILDSYSKSNNTSTFAFYAPNVNSRFAIVELDKNGVAYDAYYGTTLGAYVPMSVNNKSAWCVAGKNPYGFGNSSTGTFDIHLVSRSAHDPSGRTVGYQDYMAAGCLEYNKAAPSISEGQIVSAAFGGNIGGWSRLSKSQRITITSYMLYGVRYLSDYSFDNKLGPATIYSSNPVVNMAYAQQVLIWSVVKGINPNDALRRYANDVPYYGQRIMELAASNPEGYDYENTVMLVGEGGTKQDLVIVLEPKKEKPPAGEIIVDKSVTGSTALGGWKMELYDSMNAAKKGKNPIATAVTNSNGRAVFPDVLNGTYYVREANASKQSGDLTFWTLSDKILTVTVSSNSVNAGTIHNSYNPNYSYGLHKVSKCSTSVAQQIAGNPMYSLAGAKYKVSKDGVQQEILVTDTQGNAHGSLKYPSGTLLTIQEIEAPAGYKLDPTVYQLMITTGSNILEVQDEPLFDPPFSITKVDQASSTPQGNTTFEGAIFRWDYYTNYSWSGTPERTWYFMTNRNGVADYNNAFLAPGHSSDPLYFDAAGNPTLPLGSLKMTEIQNPLGYLVLPEPLLCKIVTDTSSPTGANHEFDAQSLKYIQNITTGNFGIYEGINKELFASIKVDKIDAHTGSVPQGNANLTATFQIVNNSVNSVKIGDFSTAAPGEVCFEFTTDASGHYASDKIFPIGSYTITEKKAPEGYQLNSEWKQNFVVTESQLEFDFSESTGNACPNNPDFIGSFTMDKLDMETGSTPQGDATLAGAEFELINNSQNPIFWEGKTVAPGEVLMTFHVDENGHYSYRGLPVGSYYIQEITPPEGYMLDLIWMYDFTITIEQPDVVVDANLTCQDLPVRGSLKVIKQDSALGNHTGADAPMDGITFSVTNESRNPVMVNGTLYNPGEVITELAIAWDGTAWSAQTEHLLPYGTYGVTENAMYENMANDYYILNPEKHLVEIRELEELVEIVHINELQDGEIIIHKVDPLMRPLAGAKFLLEWSEDEGITWNPVISSELPVKGGCTSPNLVDGYLVSGDDGLITFTGLYPTLKYRLTEIEAPAGYVLLSDTAFEGKLPGYEYTHELTVHNSAGFTFPTTGRNDVLLSVFVGTLFTITAMAGFTIIAISKRKHRFAK